jgi:site-specific DNA-methyltransferase (adenine-specific)
MNHGFFTDLEMNQKEFEKEFVNKIHLGKCVKVMRQMPDNCVDTIITDPPYFLTNKYGSGFMGKDWDSTVSEIPVGEQVFRAKKMKELRPFDKKLTVDNFNPFGRPDYLFHYRWAKEALRVAKPGAVLLCCGGTRTFHRMTCGIEDAGWVIKDCILWLYGSGFPKSLNISKAIDKLTGKCQSGRTTHPDVTQGQSEWEGWGTALKPAWEPIIVAMKPLDGTFAENAEKWGVGGLWIDGGRIDYQGEVPNMDGRKNVKMGGEGYGFVEGRPEKANTRGRFPANIILDEKAAAMLDEQSGISKPKARREGTRGGKGFGYFDDEKSKNATGVWPEDNGGGASRFFYTAKSSKSEREHENDHPTVKPLSLMTYLCKITKTPTGGIVLDPFGGSGTTALACIRTGRSYIIIEKKSEYCQIAKERIKKAKTGISVSLQRQGFKGLLDE